MFTFLWLILLVGAGLYFVIRWLRPKPQQPAHAPVQPSPPIAPVADTPVAESAVAAPAAHARPPSACDVAYDHVLGVLDSAGDRPVVYSDIVAELPDEIDATSWWGETSQPGGPWLEPPAELYARFKALNGQSAVSACPSVRALLDERGVGYGAEAVKAATHGSEDQRFFRASIWNASLPAVSDDGADAIIAWSFLHGGLAGRGSVSWLKRDADGAWDQYSNVMLWIS